MTKEEKYLKWLENAEDDLDTAQCMLKLGKNSHTVFIVPTSIREAV